MLANNRDPELGADPVESGVVRRDRQRRILRQRARCYPEVILTDLILELRARAGRSCGHLESVGPLDELDGDDEGDRQCD
jgi:hypothetical protein